jgi:hypothetical protein
VEIRAIRGLGEYPGNVQAHDTVAQLLLAADPTSRGTKVILLRAAIEALGNLAKKGHETPGDVDLLTPLLSHPSRDIRASVAHALGDLCDTGAVVPLRNRFLQETAGGQVQLAISEALRVLGTCGL